MRGEYFSTIPAASGSRLPAWRFNEGSSLGDFPGGPVVKTSSFSAGGVGSIPEWVAKIPHASWPKSQTKKKRQFKKNQKQYCNKFNKDF